MIFPHTTPLSLCSLLVLFTLVVELEVEEAGETADSAHQAEDDGERDEHDANVVPPVLEAVVVV